jgi:hypothetical protein
MIQTDPRPSNTPEAFGPSPEDVVLYRDLLEKLDNGEKLPFSPMYNAESVSKRLDDAIQGEKGTIGMFTDSEEEQTKTLGETSALKVAQQRYVAAALGFNVGPNYFTSGTVSATIEYPHVTTLPDKPQRGDDGVFRKADGTAVSQVQVDAIYSGHFLLLTQKHLSSPRHSGKYSKELEKAR